MAKIYYDKDADLDLLKGKKVAVIGYGIQGRGDTIGPFGGARFYVLNPAPEYPITDSNDNSLVLKLVYGSSSVLFCGDATASAMESMKGYGEFLKSDVIKVPHHGGNLGDPGKIKYFFDAVSARKAVISVGRYNKYRSPSRKTMEAILSSGAVIYETKDTGAISVFLAKNGKVRARGFAGNN